MKIKNWSIDDRPREKLLKLGPESLSNAELIAILLGAGSREFSAVDLAKKMLQSCENRLDIMAKKDVYDWTQFKGVGEAKAVSISAGLELGRRQMASSPLKKPQITSSQSAFNVLYPDLHGKGVEEFWVLFLNQGNHVISKRKISKGGISGTVADSRVIFKIALQLQCTSIILCHNHPSGSLIPSRQDKLLTSRMVEAGELLQIKVLDHLIIGEEDYFSFADQGQM